MLIEFAAMALFAYTFYSDILEGTILNYVFLNTFCEGMNGHESRFFNPEIATVTSLLPANWPQTPGQFAAILRLIDKHLIIYYNKIFFNIIIFSYG